MLNGVFLSVERFVNAAEAVAKGDETLDVSRSVQAAKNMIVDHDHRFTYVKHKWDEWQRNKVGVFLFSESTLSRNPPHLGRTEEEGDDYRGD